jgi:uncharacterized protein (TIGR03067 family)
MSPLSCIAVLLFALGPWIPPADQAADDLKALQGTWLVAEATNQGEPIPEEFRVQMSFVFEKDVMRLEGPMAAEPGGEKPDFPRLRIKLDPSTTPHSFDMTALNGPDKDMTVPAIYEIKGDELKFCAPNRPKDAKRPTSFSAPKDSGNIYFVLKRKPAKP